MTEERTEAAGESVRVGRRPGRSLTLTPAQATVAAALIGALSATVGALLAQRVEEQKSYAQIRIAEMNAQTEIKKEKDVAELEIKKMQDAAEQRERECARGLLESRSRRVGKRK